MHSKEGIPVRGRTKEKEMNNLVADNHETVSLWNFLTFPDVTFNVSDLSSAIDLWIKED